MVVATLHPPTPPSSHSLGSNVLESPNPSPSSSQLRMPLPTHSSPSLP
ncbi:hypothetical protein MUK42_03521 [Musa troglodytarum]|uniref:Uncharacterized protein n=1 Tax=Musa troglodytarum TaxID=320322 RepID=A0A9E7HQM6_9LILI|nr:hypothetical protein MUK42_03521 [Musa troglodytarum]